ncbi:MAG: CHRD domain-containing protein [Verrucomicrobiales bacterium]|nr:CHRD domain-containing protein [Verrucomicrobiales bacterium]
MNEQPLPATPSLATGQAHITLDILPAFTTIAWDIRWTGLSGLPTAAHFHAPAGPAASATALFSLGNFFSDSTPKSGGYSGFRQLSDPMQISAIRDGMAYVNLHTDSYPDGEIRGQLQMIPEPSSLVLIGFVTVAMRLLTLAKPE